MTPIPQPPGIPLLGNIFNVDPNNTWGSLNALAEKYGKIFKIKVLGHQIVFVANAALLEEICDEKRFRKCVTGPIVEIRRAVHDSLFTAYAHEESWGIAHRIMAPLVTKEAIQEVFSGMTETMGDLIQKWTSESNKRVDVSNDLDRVNHAANMLCFFDQRLHCMEGKEPELIKAMAEATMEAMKRPTRPSLLTWLFYQSSYDKNIKAMRDYGARIVERRKANPTDKKDMLHALIYGKDPETGKALSDSQVLDEIINIFIGSATAPNLLTFAMYYLMNNPDEITRAREEIDSVLGPNEQFQYHHLAQLPYCEAILRESLRLSAAAPGFNIEPIPGSPNPVVIGGEYEVPNNQPIIAILSAVNRDPEVFEEPEVFRPARMVGEKYDKLPAAVKKGFGNGKRVCFGTQYAWDWSFLTLAGILKDVDFEMADKSYDFSMGGKNYNGAFSVKPLNFYALVGPRKRDGKGN
ncbi:Cytochrome p450 [Aspergillus sclerotialis]|uniref:Cytochrome p450 n=1 Tax=Aspergillus sclerotialis TaxID=2070753 RepID=A0A3A2ZGW4_9EURO|nr:Cytochrome p450 [Aspergillus sclerotialis]